MHVGIKDAARRSLEWVSNIIKVLDGEKKKVLLVGNRWCFHIFSWFHEGSDLWLRKKDMENKQLDSIKNRVWIGPHGLGDQNNGSGWEMDVINATALIQKV